MHLRAGQRPGDLLEDGRGYQGCLSRLVLVAAPDARDCSQLCELLQAIGAVTSATTSLENAMSLAALQQYHLIVLAGKQARWDAVALVKAVRESKKNSTVPVVGVVAEPAVARSAELLEAGANDVLTLPTSLRAALQVLSHWCPDSDGTPMSESAKHGTEAVTAAKTTNEEETVSPPPDPQDMEQAQSRLKHLSQYQANLQEVLGKLREVAGKSVSAEKSDPEP